MSIVLIFLATSCGKFEDDVFSLVAVPPSFPQENWEKVMNPEDFGWRVEALDDIRDYAKSIKTEALMIIDKGKLIAAYGDTDKKYYVASVRKSYLSLLYGYYVDSLIALDATLSDYAIDDKNPTLNNQEKAATVRHLLTSSSGIYHKSAANSDNDDLPARNSDAPGERFYYNNWDFNALGTIFSKRTGKSIFEDFHVRIGRKIGLEDFNGNRMADLNTVMYLNTPLIILI
ncbi:MAG: serine hydrolase [Saprospiraceae bacterium]|nr:serine hydrolase [Saprospiraceae bacterium]